jgi:hypothetical protein
MPTLGVSQLIIERTEGLTPHQVSKAGPSSQLALGGTDADLRANRGGEVAPVL